MIITDISNLKKPKQVTAIPLEQTLPKTCAVSPLMKLVAYGGQHTFNIHKIFKDNDVSAHPVIKFAHPGEVEDILFVSDEQVLVCNFDQITLHNVEGKTALLTLPHRNVTWYVNIIQQFTHWKFRTRCIYFIFFNVSVNWFQCNIL
jgi:hypothetical protein